MELEAAKQHVEVLRRLADSQVKIQSARWLQNATEKPEKPERLYKPLGDYKRLLDEEPRGPVGGVAR